MKKKNIAHLLKKNIEERERTRTEFDFPEKILHPTIEEHIFEKGKRYQHWWEILTARRDELTLHMCSKPDDLTHIAELYLVPGQDNTGVRSGTFGAEISRARERLNRMGYELRGTLHSHPGMGCFFSGMDKRVNEDTLDALKGSQYEQVKFRKTRTFDGVDNLKLGKEKEIKWDDYFSNQEFSFRKRKDGKVDFTIEENNYVSYIYAVVINDKTHICGMLSQRISNNLQERFPMDDSKARPGNYLKLDFVSTQEKTWTDEQIIVDILEKQMLDPARAISRIPDKDLKDRLLDMYEIEEEYYAGSLLYPQGEVFEFEPAVQKDFKNRHIGQKKTVYSNTGAGLFAQPGDRERYEPEFMDLWQDKPKYNQRPFLEDVLGSFAYNSGKKLLGIFSFLRKGTWALYRKVRKDPDYLKKQFFEEEKKKKEDDR